ncbi:hypothetical protein GCM10027060_19950 [Nesterenkonia halophila]|uniref:DUF2231 domain-containing protein n=1 Tax=Nesterenkonia halophila TaxID=302044 RepID=UPI001291ECEF|nr:DUF2231 domain-containing protein [Nesterenkonia halophila]
MILDLPLHPLIVHAVVVLVPLSAVLVLLAVLVPPLRRSCAPVGAVLAVVGAISALVAERSGRALAETVGVPADHEPWGTPTLIASAVFAVLAVVWHLGQRRAGRRRRGSPAVRVLGALTVLAALAAVGLTLISGHTGAEAVWGDIRNML